MQFSLTNCRSNMWRVGISWYQGKVGSSKWLEKVRLPLNEIATLLASPVCNTPAAMPFLSKGWDILEYFLRNSLLWPSQNICLLSLLWWCLVCFSQKIDDSENCKSSLLLVPSYRALVRCPRYIVALSRLMTVLYRILSVFAESGASYWEICRDTCRSLCGRRSTTEAEIYWQDQR